MTRSALAAAGSLFALLLFVPTASAQTVEELIAMNLAAKGGLEQIRAITSIRQTSHLTTQGLDADMTILSKRPNLMRQEIRIGGETQVLGFDGQTPWVRNSAATGSNEAVPVTGGQADMLRDQASFDGPLVNYKERGAKAELVGRETVDGRSVHHLKLTSARGQVQHIYLDAETNLESRIVSESASGRMEQALSDYRDVQGMKIPFRITMLAGGTVVGAVTVLNVEFNPDLDDALFRMGGDR
jgi:outer membrane lipoprotein-sorting protein